MGNRGILVGMLIFGLAVMMIVSSLPAYANHTTVGPQGSCTVKDPPSGKVFKIANLIPADTPTLDKRDINANGWVCQIFIQNPSHFTIKVVDDRI